MPLRIIRAGFKILPACGLVCLSFSLRAVEPTGWMMRYGHGESRPDLGNLPHVTLNPLPTVLTNVTSLGLLRATGGGGRTTGFQRILPPCESPRIRELARGLDYDWRKCYFFVRDEIAFTPAPGFMRGPDRTLLDREGTDADQAWLLHALLEECDVSSTILYAPPPRTADDGFAFSVPVTNRFARFPYNAAGWLGLRESMESDVVQGLVTSVFCNAGRSLRFFEEVGDETVLRLAMDHFWVIAEVEDNAYMLDPSLKPMCRIRPHDALAESGCQFSGIAATAGGNVTDTAVYSMSTAGLDGYLDARSAALRQVWTNTQNGVKQFIGTRQIVKQTDGEFFHGDCCQLPLDVFTMPTDDVNELRTRVRLSMGTVTNSFFLDELGLRRLWLSFENSAALYPRAVLHLDDSILVQEASGSPSPALQLGIAVAIGTNAFRSATYALSRSTSNVYAIPVGFGSDARGGMRTLVAEELAEARDMGWADSDPRLLARSLHLAGQEWQAQRAMMNRVQNGLSACPSWDLYVIGISGQNGAPYVDVKNLVSFGGLIGASSHDRRHLFSSALEHAVLDQLNGSSLPAVSTMKIFELANAANIPVHYADSNTWPSVSAALTGYSTSDIAHVAASIALGGFAVLPQNGNVSLNSWTGAGYVIQICDDSNMFTEMAISGGYNGGYCTENIVPSSLSYANGTLTARYDDGAVLGSVQADPVAMPSGAFLDHATDLELKGGRSLAWTRSYDSRRRRDDGPLGRGWTHSFDATVSVGTDADAVFGDGSVAAVIPTVLAVAAVQNILTYGENLSAGEKARRWLLASLIVRWWTRRHVGAAVHVRHDTRVLSFQRQEDGSYAPAPGVTATLTKSGSEYRLEERLGSTYKFNSSGQLREIVDRSGNVTTLTFSGGHLSRIANGFGAYFDLSWTGNHIASVTDSAGRTASYAYDTSGHMGRYKDCYGMKWRFSYEGSTHAMVSQTDPLWRVLVSNSYNSLCQVTNQVSSVGGVTTFGYAADTAAWNVDPLGGRLEERFDRKGRVTSRTDRCGAKTTFEYDGNGNETLRRDALGLEFSRVYDARCNMYASDVGTSGVMRVTRYAHDGRDRLIATTNARGQVERIAYDESSGDLPRQVWKRDGRYCLNFWSAQGLLENVKHKAADDTIYLRTPRTFGAYGLPETRRYTGIGLPVEGVAESCTYDSRRRLLSETDANGHVRTFTYNDTTNRTHVYEADGAQTKFYYDECGRLFCVRDPLLRKTNYILTASGQVTSTIYPDGTFVTNVYDMADRLVRTIDERGSWTDYVRDAEGRVTATITPAGTNSVVYDAVGRVVSETDATGRTRTFGYNLYGELATECDGLSNVVRYAYNKLGLRTSMTNALGHVRRWGYDVTDRMIGTRRPSGVDERFTYDTLDNLVSVTNAEGHVYQMAYDALGRMTAATNALGARVFEAKYDGVGNMTNRVDGNGTETVCSYDVRNWLARRTTADGTDSFSYDMVGNLLSASNSVAFEAFAYDLRDRLTNAVTRIGTNTWESAWLRDAGGLVTNVSFGAGKAVSRTYDLAGRLVAVRDWLGHEWTFAWDGASRPTGGTSPGGTAHSFSYDAAGRLSAWSVSGVAGRTIERDAAGRRTRDTVTAGPVPAAALQRNAENAFDAADRLVSATAAYGGSATPVTETFLYDGNGAMTNATSGGETVFAAAYDAQGRLASLGGPPSSAASFSYDALGNRVRVGGHIFVPDHSDPLKRPLVECDADGTPLRYYIWGPGRLLGFIDAGRAGSPLPADALTVAHSDEQGSVVALTDETGALLYRANYSPHGEDWGSSGTNATPFAWLGGLGVMRTRTGGPPSSAAAFSTLYLTRHRLYSPVLRRFLSADPLGIDGGLNLYAYANGDPLAYIDPLGLCASDDKWYDRLSAWTLEKVGVAKDYYGEHLPWWMAGTVATAMDLVTSVAHFPAAIGHLGEGAGTFAGNPSLETAPGLCYDIATVATIGAFTARALPSLNGSAARATAISTGATTERTVNPVSVLKNVGSPGKSRGVRVVDSEQDLVELFNQSTKGAQTLPSGTYPGVVRKLPDGTIMRLRSHSKSGGSTIDITFRNGELMKVHIK